MVCQNGMIAGSALVEWTDQSAAAVRRLAGELRAALIC
jgi:hypothetical protein